MPHVAVTRELIASREQGGRTIVTIADRNAPDDAESLRLSLDTMLEPQIRVFAGC